MLKNTLLLSTALLLFSGCAERGYKLTVNNATGTVTAEKSIDIRQTTKSTTKTDIHKMQKAVKQEQTRGKPMGRSADKAETEKSVSPTVSKIKTDELARKHEAQNKKIEEAKIVELKAAKEHQLALENEKAAKQAMEAHKLAEEKEAALLKTEEEKRLLAIQEEKERERVRKQLAEKKKLAQFEKEEAALFKKLEEKLLVLQKKQEAEALKLKQAENKRIELEKEKQTKLAQEKEEKRLLAINEREAKEAHQKEVAQAKRLKEAKAREVKKAPLLTTQGLTFKPSSQTYQKFGTSEIHGHVIYLSPDGVEIFLKNTKIYLVAQNTKMDYWYTNYYLKNRHNSARTQSIVNYINATKLNLERNFAFYGLAPGNYYVVIESSYPKSMAKNKNVYITKRITVEKYKKIMTVFSKKL